MANHFIFIKMKIKLLMLTVFLSFAFLCSEAKNQALLIGIGDYNPETTGWNKLNGNNDVDLLEGKLKAKGFSVFTLKDSEATKNNIKTALSRLVSSANAGDEIYVHFSGHGQLVEDMNNDEPDGLDQSFICYDACYSPKFKIRGASYRGENHLIDDELFPYINQLKSKVGSKGRIIIAFDSCYSGGADRGKMSDDPEPDSEVEFTSVTRGSDIMFPSTKESKAYLRSIKAPAQYKGTGGEVIVISACERDKKNYETKEKHSGKGYGSLTYCISKLLDHNVPINDWEDFFNSQKYKSYKIFRSTQHPVVERH